MFWLLQIQQIKCTLYFAFLSYDLKLKHRNILNFMTMYALKSFFSTNIASFKIEQILQANTIMMLNLGQTSGTLIALLKFN